MTATQALRVFRTGNKVRLPGGEDGTIEGTSLGMELARMGSHRKLVLYIKVYGIARTFPHYAL